MPVMLPMQCKQCHGAMTLQLDQAFLVMSPHFSPLEHRTAAINHAEHHPLNSMGIVPVMFWTNRLHVDIVSSEH
jgi:hypothetical protein